MDRKLATIFASDVVGFSKMMGTDEVKTLEILKERREVIDSIIDNHGGIIFGSAGDSVIAEFASPIKAAITATFRASCRTSLDELRKTKINSGPPMARSATP